MCESGTTLMMYYEGVVMETLCADCRRRAESRLKGTGKRLFELPEDEYGFCERCKAEIEKLQFD